ncbi:GNAT family N-acetyltransferase [Virgibacillus sp. DJP39]|uniref:GNAT family N-acetyltransferase n=1 Tax=Virgibacillus sp. DJP39 TaxID=3409790 RepID=UPI003BB605A5
METYLTELKPDLLSAYIRVDLHDPGSFCKKAGFHKWWGSTELFYSGGGFPQSKIEFSVYEDKYFEQYVKVNQECYYPIQKSNDLKPYIASEKVIKQYKLNNKENVYLALDNEEIIASVTIGNGEIDNLIVAPNYQGKGYGKEALQFGMNKLLRQGHKEIRICYMENNTVAENLYYLLGFKFLQNTHVYRKFL